MKHILTVLSLLCIMSVCVFPSHLTPVYGWDLDAEIERANIFLEKTYDRKGYFTKTCDFGDVIKEYIVDGHNAFHGYPIILYGSPETATDSYFEGKASSSPAGKYSNLNKEYRTLGFTYEGCPFPNPFFPNDYYGNKVNNDDSVLVEKKAIEIGVEQDDTNRAWVKNPYRLLANGEDGNTRELSRNLPGIGNKIQVNKPTVNMINSWVRTIAFSPDEIADNIGDPAYYAKLVVNPPKSIKDNLEDYMAVLSPPTDHIWGIGIAFYYTNTSGTLEIDTAPFTSCRLQCTIPLTT